MSAFEQLAGALRFLRERRGLTQRQLADAIESPLKQINAYENGRQRPRIETLERILAAVGADAMDLSDVMAGLAHAKGGKVALPAESPAEVPAAAPAPAGGEGPAPAPAVALSPELRELAPRLPQIEALANEVLIELLSEAVDRQARWLSDDLRAGRPAVELPRRERDDGG
jgi:transcriptional regulator with XRE-family HTH domain